MSFRRDLQAWARAEVRRRAADGQQSAIESLLYPPYQSARSHQSRSGFPPTIGIGQQINGPVLLTDSDFILEHGMMWRELPPQTVPVDVYSTEWTREYLTSPGTATPTAPPLQYLIGTLAKSQTGELYWPTSASYWLPYPYKSQVWTDQDQWDNLWPISKSLQPNAYTGLLRLLIQVVLGGNLDPAAVFGSADPLRPGEDGLFRMWDATLDTYQYWLIRASLDDSYVVARPMLLAPESQSILEWLNAHHRGSIVLDDNTRRLYDSWVMRGMTVGAGVQIAGPTELGPIWANNADPIAHGWAYTRQRFGTPLEDVTKASIVTHGLTTVGSPTGTYRWHAQHAHLEFSLNNGVLSVLPVIQDGPTDWCLLVSQGPVWFPSADGTQYESLENPPNMVGDPATPVVDVPLYCFWSDQKEEMTRFNMLYESTDDVDTDNYGPIEICGGEGGGSKTYKNLSVLSYGGPYIAGVTPSSGTFDLGEQRNKNFNVGKIGERIKGAPYSDSFRVDPDRPYFCAIPLGCWPLGWYNSEPFCDTTRSSVYGQFTYDVVRAVETEDIVNQNLWSLERPLIITNDPEAVYSVSHSRITGSTSTTIWDFTSTNIAASLTTGGEWTWDGTNVDTFKERFGSRGGYWVSGDPGTGMGPTGDDGEGNPLNPPTSETITPIDTITDSAYLVSADQSRSLPSGGDWSQFFFSSPMSPVGLSVDSNRSYYNASGYYANSPGDWFTTDGLPYNHGDGLLFPLGAV